MNSYIAVIFLIVATILPACTRKYSKKESPSIQRIDNRHINLPAQQ